MHVLRPLLFLLCWLSALLPRADANGTAPTASDLPMLLSTLKDGGNLYAPEFLRRVLVRQNPWSAFDPEGLAENKAEYDTLDEAAVLGLRHMLETSAEGQPGREANWKVEWGIMFFRDKKTLKHGYNTPRTDNLPGTVLPWKNNPIPDGTVEAGVGHNHPPGAFSASNFSHYEPKGGGDTATADERGVPIFMITVRNGVEIIRKYTPVPNVKEDPSQKDKGKIETWDPKSKRFREWIEPEGSSGKPIQVGVGTRDGRKTEEWQYPGGEPFSVPQDIIPPVKATDTTASPKKKP